MKNYIVFGAGGSIGREIARQLAVAGHSVLACIRRHNLLDVPLLRQEKVEFRVVEDVSDRDSCLELASVYAGGNIRLHGVIYSVGHCPPNGFVEAIRYPLSQLPVDIYLNEIRAHATGVINVFQTMLGCVNEGGCFIFLSSAITRLKGQFPPFLQAHYHAGLISAEDWLIDGMRADPQVIERKIKIHRIAPAAVDTPFHASGPRPPRLIPVADVVQGVILGVWV